MSAEHAVTDHATPRVDELRQRLRVARLSRRRRRSLRARPGAIDTRGRSRSRSWPACASALLAALLLGPAARIGLARAPARPRHRSARRLRRRHLPWRRVRRRDGTRGAGGGAAGGAGGARVGGRSGAPRPRAAANRRRRIGLRVPVYLTLWWQTRHRAASAGRRPVWTASALAIAVAISLLLGHAVAMVTSALLVARTSRADEAGARPQAPRRDRRDRWRWPQRSRSVPPRCCSHGRTDRRRNRQRRAADRRAERAAREGARHRRLRSACLRRAGGGGAACRR